MQTDSLGSDFVGTSARVKGFEGVEACGRTS